MKNRLSQKTERFLSRFKIEWHDASGYVRDFDGESGVPCSVNLIEGLERLMYSLKGKGLSVGQDRNTPYFSESSVLDVAAAASRLFVEELQYIRQTSSK